MRRTPIFTVLCEQCGYISWPIFECAAAIVDSPFVALLPRVLITVSVGDRCGLDMCIGAKVTSDKAVDGDGKQVRLANPSASPSARKAVGARGVFAKGAVGQPMVSAL